MAGVAGLALFVELRAETMGQIKADQILVKDLAGERQGSEYKLYWRLGAMAHSPRYP